MVPDHGSLLEVVEIVYVVPSISDVWGVPKISPVNVLKVRPEGNSLQSRVYGVGPRLMPAQLTRGAYVKAVWCVYPAVSILTAPLCIRLMS